MKEVMDVQPLISVIIPVYNVENYVKRCINSILKQTYSFWELIVVDDGSTDGSGAICDEFSKLDSRITIIHKTNGGVSSARLKGVNVSKGDYITFVDADDALRPDALEVLTKAAANYKSDVIIGDFEKNSSNSMKRINSNRVSGWLNKEEYLEATVLLKLSMSTQARLYKRHLFDPVKLNIDRRIVQNEDFLWNLIISHNVHSAFVLNAVVYTVYVREGSASRTKRAFDYWKFFFLYIEDNLNVFDVDKDSYMLFKITRLADLMRNYYTLSFKDTLFDNIRNFRLDNRLSIWGKSIVVFSHNPWLGAFQGLLKIHPSKLAVLLR